MLQIKLYLRTLFGHSILTEKSSDLLADGEARRYTFVHMYAKSAFNIYHTFNIFLSFSHTFVGSESWKGLGGV